MQTPYVYNYAMSLTGYVDGAPPTVCDGKRLLTGYGGEAPPTISDGELSKTSEAWKQSSQDSCEEEESPDSPLVISDISSSASSKSVEEVSSSASSKSIEEVFPPGTVQLGATSQAITLRVSFILYMYNSINSGTVE